jgi:MFS family permease
MQATGRALVAAAAALALADASIVALALPPLLVELHTTVTGVAAVVGVYALVLGLGVIPAERLVRTPAAAAAGLLVFAAGSALCATASSLGLLLVWRAVQAAGGAAALPAAFTALDAGATSAGRRIWLGAALAGTAAGPAIGGALTQALDWRAIFAVQAPVAVAAAVAVARAGKAPASSRADAAAPGPAAGPPSAGGLWAAPAAPPPSAAAPAGAGSLPAATAAPAAPWPALPTVSLGLVAAAFTAVLFMLVLELVAGFAYTPLNGALAVTVLPLSALAGGALRGPPRARAAAGALLVAGGAAALAFLPKAGLAWTVPPQVLTGVGIGLAVPAFAGELLPESTALDAARLLAVRHAGTVLVLAILAPVATHALRVGTDRAILRGTALVLDARLPPLEKLDLAPGLLDGVQSERPRATLRAALDRRRADLADDPGLAGRLDGVVVRAVLDAFRAPYLIAGLLGLLGAALLLPRAVRAAVGVAALVAALTVAVYVVEQDRRAPPVVALRDPCKPRPLPRTGGITGLLQDQALKLLDRSACRAGSSREELVLALADKRRAAAFERRYGVDPRSLAGALSLLGG